MDDMTKALGQGLREKFDEVEMAREVFQLQDQQLNALKAEVQRAGGLIMVFMHPYFQGRHFFFRDRDKTDRLENRIDAFIASESKNKPPIFLLEEERYVSKTARWLYRNAVGTIVHVIPTGNGIPTPILSVHGQDMSWDALRSGFRYLGVKKILIGGTGLGRFRDDVLTPEGRPNWENYDMCVGGALQELGRQFEVEVSSFTYPLTRKEVHPKSRR